MPYEFHGYTANNDIIPYTEIGDVIRVSFIMGDDQYLGEALVTDKRPDGAISLVGVGKLEHKKEWEDNGKIQTDYGGQDEVTWQALR